ncbi:MAG: alpha/beta hydrolase-fold protein [Candidatus Sericytochromatia bacterium]|nr:alpha/beta hydrolase-fold protein [Candidatus Sericytochromatia bacterium]
MPIRRLQTAQGRLHHSKAFEIPGVPGPHPLTVYLPPGYDQSHGRYPVAFIFDGQNVFGDHGSFAGGWHLDHALDLRAGAGRQVPIVIAIHHGPQRARELSPWPVEEGQEPLGNTFLEWVVGPLLQMVQEDLRVLDGPENTLIGGSSLGGLLALYGFFKHNDIFGKALVMSPSLWVAEGKIFEFVARARCGGDPRIYLDCGAREAEGIVIQHAEWMNDLLTRKGFFPGYHVLWRPDTHGAHNERHWRRRLPRAMRFLYDMDTPDAI